MEWDGAGGHIEGSDASVEFRSVKDNGHSGDRVRETVDELCYVELYVDGSGDGTF